MGNYWVLLELQRQQRTCVVSTNPKAETVTGFGALGLGCRV